MKRIKKQYSWWDVTRATEESGKSLAELFDFKSGTLIDYENAGEIEDVDSRPSMKHEEAKDD